MKRTFRLPVNDIFFLDDDNVDADGGDDKDDDNGDDGDDNDDRRIPRGYVLLLRAPRDTELGDSFLSKYVV